MSGYLEYLMKRHDILTEKLVDDWNEHGIARFHVGDLREGGAGIIESEDPDDDVRGKAHALARCQAPGMKPKSAWSTARRFALQRAIYYESDPGYLDDEV